MLPTRKGSHSWGGGGGEWERLQWRKLSPRCNTFSTWKISVVYFIFLFADRGVGLKRGKASKCHLCCRFFVYCAVFWFGYAFLAKGFYASSLRNQSSYAMFLCQHATVAGNLASRNLDPPCLAAASTCRINTPFYMVVCFVHRRPPLCWFCTWIILEKSGISKSIFSVDNTLTTL